MAALSWLCLAGSIPTEWVNGGGFQSLQELWLYNNSLAGSLPTASTRQSLANERPAERGAWHAARCPSAETTTRHKQLKQACGEHSNLATARGAGPLEDPEIVGRG